MLTSNAEISKIEKTYLWNHLQVSLVPDGQLLFDKRLVFPDELIYGTFENTCVKCPEVVAGYVNAQPPGRDKIANAPLPRLSMWANAPRFPGGEMGAVGIRWG